MNQEVTSPKLLNNKFDFTNKSLLYHYYPGYSELFVRQVIERYCSDKESSIILDPWNGSGTTTLVASVLGYKCYGYDINPIMVIVAKAKLHMPSRKEVQALLDLLQFKLKSHKQNIDTELDPLRDWFDEKSTEVIRNIEHVTRSYCDHEKNKRNNSEESISRFSNMTSFYYMAMFSVLKKLTHKFSSSNPTWIKLAKGKHELVICNEDEIMNLLSNFFENMFNRVNAIKMDFQSSIIGIGNSENLSLEKDSIDAIITSPPYCTRIDYAVYTRVELAYLGYDKGSLRDLRHKMVGTPTITSKIYDNSGSILVEYCNYLLEKIKGHYSKASESYYHKTYNQYFISLTKSVSEISRVLKTKGILAIVVQDSWFKDIHIDLQRVLIEICESYKLILFDKYDFSSNTNMGYLNNNSKKYRTKLKAVESVLLFVKEEK